MNKAIIIVSVMFLAFFVFVFYWTLMRPPQIKAYCWDKAYGLKEISLKPRLNEDNYNWAPGKQWLPKPGSGEVTTPDYVWIYPDQDTTTNVGDIIRTAEKEHKDDLYNQCLRDNWVSY